jgi:hypothetical protein
MVVHGTPYKFASASTSAPAWSKAIAISGAFFGSRGKRAEKGGSGIKRLAAPSGHNGGRTMRFTWGRSAPARG